jgi:hypothetical protein
MGKEQIILMALEALRVLIRGAIEFARATGLSQEQIETAFQEEKAKFLLNDPDNIHLGD